MLLSNYTWLRLTHGRQAAGTVDGGARESMLKLEAEIVGIEWGSVVVS